MKPGSSIYHPITTHGLEHGEWGSELTELGVRLTYMLAENLPPDFVIEKTDSLVMKRTTEGKLASAWAHLELSICQNVPLTDEMRRDNFWLISSLLQDCMTHTGSRSNEKLRLEAALLSAQLPLFAYRAINEQPSSKNIFDTYTSIGAAIDYVYRNGRPTEGTDLPSQCAEAVVMALAARTGQPNWVLYQSSPREERSPFMQGNHDCYRIANDKKIWVQVRTQSTDKLQEETIVKVVTQDIVNHAGKLCRRLQAKGVDTTDVTIEEYEHILALIVAETKGKSLSAAEKRILDAASAMVIGHITDKTSPLVGVA